MKSIDVTISMNELHMHFVNLKNKTIGITFPYSTKKKPGEKIRLHGQERDLENFIKLSGIDSKMNDSYETVFLKRYRRKITPSKQRRYMRRVGVPCDTSAYSESVGIKVPVRSLSTGKNYNLFLVDEKFNKNKHLFNTHGLLINNINIQ